MVRGVEKRGQMKMSFGMIFSIILIIFFLAFAFFGIKKFVGVQEEIAFQKFKADFQDDINTIWQGSKSSVDKSYSLPKKILAVCIKDNEFGNLYFESSKGYYDGEILEHVDVLGSLPQNSEHLCFDNVDGKVTINLEKGFGDDKVTLSIPQND